MKNPPSNLPNTPQELQSIILGLQARLTEQEARLAAQTEQLATQTERLAALKEGLLNTERKYESQLDLLLERIRLMVAEKYGARSEKLKYGSGVGQQELPFFDEAGTVTAAEAAEPEPEEVTVPEHTRKKAGRKPLPAELPRVVVVHDLPEEEKVCPCGCPRREIGRECSEQLDVVPAKVQVIRHERIKYALSPACTCDREGTDHPVPAVVTAPMPEQMIPKSLASPGTLSHVLTAKFADALPFYRQEGQFKRMGVEVTRSTMCGWAMQVGDQCSVLVDLLAEELLGGPVVHMDETRVQVMNEEGRADTTQSYMWVSLGGPPGHRVVIFRYHPTRSGAVAEEILAGYKGYVQTDGYIGYDFLKKQSDVVHVGCMAHVRRKFVEIVKLAGKSPGKGGKGNAQHVLDEIGKLYAVEKKAREGGLSPEEIYRLRQAEAKPVFDKLEEFLRDLQPKTPPQGLLGQAVSYALGQWDRVAHYLDDGRVQIDNNLAENAIRPFVVGRKNWLFHGDPEGAKAGAVLYSLIETAKANGLEPYAYLRFLFETLPGVKGKPAIRALLPTHLDASFKPRP
jgi:transposase